MNFLDGVWHLCNFFAPAVVVALLATAGVKLLWRRELRQLPWIPLAGVGAASGSLALVLGLVVSGRDGRMLTYAAMCLACALALWWFAFYRARR